jgi:hypothetical protein
MPVNEPQGHTQQQSRRKCRFFEVSSWLGGVPRAPKGFQWPKGRDGKAMIFVAQIDLAALRPEPVTGARAPGLPADGALLVFMGDGYAIRVLTNTEVENGAPVTPPLMAPDVGSLGFWGKGKTFNAWAVDPVPFISRVDETRPTALPNPFTRLADWVTNWGIAALEVSILIEALDQEFRQGREFVEHRKQQLAAGVTLSMPDHIEKRLRHCETMEQHAPGLLAELRSWQARAGSMPPEAPVDLSELETIVASRQRFLDRLETNYGARHLLAGNAEAVWAQIVREVPEFERNQDFSNVPPVYRPLVEAKITSWRGHRLFGLEPEFPNNWEDLRGQDPIISIASDALLGTQSEHNYGFSVWLNREQMAGGHHEGGQLIHHCAV